MARKIFISYKYGDMAVYPLQGIGQTKVRDYVTLLQTLLDREDHINKGEADGESLAGFKEDTIASKLRDKIYDSSITLVLISKNMKNPFEPEEDQWIPWEISYSLKEHSRDGRMSYANAVLAIVIPDEYASYEHFILDSTCAACNSRTIRTDQVFSILGRNMLNKKYPEKLTCSGHSLGFEPHIGDHSYINVVKWDEFVNDINKHLDEALRISENINDYNIIKTV